MSLLCRFWGSPPKIHHLHQSLLRRHARIPQLPRPHRSWSRWPHRHARRGLRSRRSPRPLPPWRPARRHVPTENAASSPRNWSRVLPHSAGILRGQHGRTTNLQPGQYPPIRPLRPRSLHHARKHPRHPRTRRLPPRPRNGLPPQ